MGVILLTILFGGVVGYRMVRPAPSAILPVEVPSAVPPADSAPEPPVVAAAPVASPQPGSEVPPPPPVSSAPRRTVRRNPAPAAVPSAKIIQVDQALAIEERPTPLPELSAFETPKLEKPETPVVSTPVVKPDPPATPQIQPAPVNDAPKTDAHGKGFVRAFRKLLHIPKKDEQPDTLKQP
jgi:hypothetical protein